MFSTLIIVLHVIVCVALILIVLLQTGKGADIGAVFGGGSSQTLFGSSGAGTFLSKVTIGAAVVFMLTSITLSYFSGRGAPVQRSIMSEQPAPAAPEVPVQPAPASPEGAQETPVKETPAADSQGAVPEARPDTAGEAAPVPAPAGETNPPASDSESAPAAESPSAPQAEKPLDK